jgi:ABC-type sugar transport system ATPase subunit
MTAPSGVRVEMRGIAKRFGATAALRGVDLVLPAPFSSSSPWI